jgi:hypothetical protein
MNGSEVSWVNLVGREAEHLMPKLVSGVKPSPVHTPS